MAPFTILALAFYAITVSSTPCSTEARPTASIDSGVVVGTTTSLPSSPTTVNQFLGIPFGEPPIRFNPPHPAASWESPYDASEYKPACVQEFKYPEVQRNLTIEWYSNPGPPAGESEDCLNLNVFAPAGAAEGSKAVLFWIFGGSFVFGSGSIPLYDGTSFAANHDVVVVTINYRTNVFGFPGSSETEANLGSVLCMFVEKTRDLTSLHRWLDQRLALDWVQRNIAALGGDPARVTIAGESAGAGSVDVLVTTPPDPVPFHAAIMESGQGTLYDSGGASAKSWNEIVKALDCPSDNELECVRAVPASELKELVERHQLSFNPEKDGGATWVDTPRTNRLNSTDEDSLIARVPILIGSNADEGRTDALGQNDTEAYLRSNFGKVASDEAVQMILSQYPIGSPEISSEYERISKISSEYSFQCPAGIVAQESATVGIDSWRYYFNGSFPNSQLFEDSGVYHTSEIELVFGTYEKEGATDFQIEVSQAMQEAWAKFAKDPSCGPGWEAAPHVGVFGGGARVGLDDTGREALVTIDAKNLDRRCVLYKQVYDGAK